MIEIEKRYNTSQPEQEGNTSHIQNRLQNIKLPENTWDLRVLGVMAEGGAWSVHKGQSKEGMHSVDE